MSPRRSCSPALPVRCVLCFCVNVGGLGTLIASMANVISYRAYAEIPEAKSGTYMMVFTLYNLIFLIIMCEAGWMLLSL